MKYVGKSSFEQYPWFHPDDADEVLEVDGSEVLVYDMEDGSKLGFKHVGGEEYDFNNYEVYELG